MKREKIKTMKNNQTFPINLFPDIENEDKYFPKYTKVNVSEDYIAENFKQKGWDVYTPYADTGIDLVITKYIENDKGIKKSVTRFIQIKTRALTIDENNKNKAIFGYTLKSKDFRNDPRGVIVFFNDNSDIGSDNYDIFTIPMYEFINFFFKYSNFKSSEYTYGESQFSTDSFRQENNKINNLHFNIKEQKWNFGKVDDFERFRGMNGYNLIDSLDIDNNYQNYKKEINDKKNKLYYHLKNKNNYTNYEKELINIYNNINNETDFDRKEKFKSVELDFNKKAPYDVIKSSKKYYKTQRGNTDE